MNTRIQAEKLRRDGLSYTHIARQLHVSKERIRQVLPAELRGPIAPPTKKSVERQRYTAQELEILMTNHRRGSLISKPATCHPGRHAFQKSQRCRECWQGTRLLRSAGVPPPRIVGVIQHTFTRWPERCPKCWALANAAIQDDRLFECLLCGYTGYLTHGERALPRVLTERPLNGGVHV